MRRARFRAWLDAASVEGPARRSALRRLGAAIAVWYVRLCLLPGAFFISLLSVPAALLLASEFDWRAGRGIYVAPGKLLGMATVWAIHVTVLGAYSSWAPVGVGPGERAVARGAAIALGVTMGAVLAIQTAVLFCA